MTVKEFINATTHPVHVMIPWPSGNYHPHTKKHYISSMGYDDDVSNREIDFFETDTDPELEKTIITVYTK